MQPSRSTAPGRATEATASEARARPVRQPLQSHTIRQALPVRRRLRDPCSAPRRGRPGSSIRARHVRSPRRATARSAIAPLSRMSTSSSGVRCLMARCRESSSNSPTRERVGFDRQPSCPEYPQSPDATARGMSAESGRHAVDWVAQRWLALTATARSSRSNPSLGLSVRCRRSEIIVKRFGLGFLRRHSVEAAVDGDAIPSGRERRLPCASIHAKRGQRLPRKGRWHLRSCPRIDSRLDR